MNDELYKVYLDSGKCVRILGRVLDSGTCFGFWDVFWILGSVLGSGTCFVPTSYRRMFMFSGKNRWRILDP